MAFASAAAGFWFRVSGSLSKRLTGPWPLILLALAGVTIRLIAAIRKGFDAPGISEMYLISRAFGRTGEIADAFLPGSGPTAHVSPLPPIIAGSVYRLTGQGGLPSEACLTFCSLGTVFLGFWVLLRAFTTAGMSRKWAVGAFALLALVPVYFVSETIVFRTWEGGQAALLFATGLLLIAISEERNGFSRARLAWMSVIVALSFLISPIVGMALIACTAVFHMLRRQWLKIAGVSTLLGCVALLAVTPWALRNERVLGSPVLTRTNFGLVLASAYNDEVARARTDDERMHAFPRHLGAINPYCSEELTRKMQREGGEVVFNQRLKEQALRWIRDNPGKSAALALRYAGDFLFTPAYSWAFFLKLTPMMHVKAAVSAAITVFGLFGLAICLVRRERLAVYGLVYIGAATCLYALSQPTPRYHYIIHPALVFFGFRGLELLTGTIRRTLAGLQLPVDAASGKVRVIA